MLWEILRGPHVTSSTCDALTHLTHTALPRFHNKMVGPDLLRFLLIPARKCLVAFRENAREVRKRGRLIRVALVR